MKTSDVLGINELVLVNGTARRKYLRTTLEPQYIVLHHSRWGSARYTVRRWKVTPDLVATHYIIDRDGSAYRVLPDRAYTYHVRSPLGRHIDALSIGITLAGHGEVVCIDGEWFGKISALSVDESEVYEINGTYFHRYTTEQIESLVRLCRHLLREHPSIPNAAPRTPTWSDAERRYYRRLKGIFAHGHLRPDKDDIYPCPSLWETIRSELGITC